MEYLILKRGKVERIGMVTWAVFDPVPSESSLDIS